MTKQVSIKELECMQDEVGAWYYTLNGIPYTGCAIQWYTDGEIIAENNFVKGYFEGVQKEWHLNRQLKSIYGMKNNIQHGSITSWYENGILRYEAEYNMGQIIWSKMYNEQGDLVKQHP